ncbi:MAG: NUDIX domain-containing protein [Defluviitaleaceae bacterium]|nr:NUDIX domain-containing protein [Defluviitaleaceae bacterium]
MITLRNGVAAFLRHKDEYLLLKRAKTKRVAPGKWSGVGGHIEPQEMNYPLDTCYREIEEETGIEMNQISALELLYIIIHRIENEILQMYIYFGDCSTKEILHTDEGVLVWIAEKELANLEYSSAFSAMIVHYLNRTPNDKELYVGVAEKRQNVLSMTWTSCVDL